MSTGEIDTGPTTPAAPAPVDVQQLMAEIRAEVDWKRRAGLYPPDVLEELDVSLGGFDKDSLDAAIQLLRRSATFKPLVTTASQKGGAAAPLAAGFKRAVQRSTSWYISAVLQQVELFATRATRVIGLLADRVTRMHEELEQEVADKTAEVRVSVDRLTRNLEALSIAEDLPTWRERLARVERAVRTIDGRPSENGPPSEPHDRGFGTDLVIDYVDFENQFRGTEEQIRAKQLAYVDAFKDADGPVVDLGCGRGEFLELLRDANIDAYGVDRLPGMIERCRQKTLDAREGDVLDHLSSAPASSLGGIFCSQMIEHLDVGDVPVFFELAARALVTGGRLIVETINPASLIVFSQAFYLDLGHLRPLHPLMLSYLAEKAGFADVAVRYSSYPPAHTRPMEIESAGEPVLDAVIERVNENFRRLDEAIFGPQDYAVIATR